MKMPISRIVVILTCLLVASILGCGDGEAERKTQALNAAQDWTQDSTDTVIEEVLNLVTSEIPGASLFTGIIASEIADLLSWEYSEPVKTTDAIYEVTATVSTQMSLDLPLVGSKTYEARLPIDLEIDVSDGSVTEWSADTGNSSVGEVEPSP